CIRDRYYQGKPRGIPSPIEQNNRHKLLLQQAFNSDEMNLPTRLGLKMKPFSFFNMILVGSSAIIKRPQNGKNVEDLDRIIKVDHLYKRINKDINPLNPILFAKQVATMTQMISTETLQTFAENLAALHKPAKKTDWKVRFG
ncbi:nuclease-related domain-containing protein, partial [Kingella kingae]|uniref:nuclease-related domain-containing protein n=1 Tax=Kingella kingae TaxID=504 RepID=UPI0025565FC6